MIFSPLPSFGHVPCHTVLWCVVVAVQSHGNCISPALRVCADLIVKYGLEDLVPTEPPAANSGNNTQSPPAPLYRPTLADPRPEVSSHSRATSLINPPPDPQVDVLGPKSRRWGDTAGLGVPTWTHLANIEGSCPPLCGHDTEQ